VHVNFYLLFYSLFDGHLPRARRALIRLAGWDASFVLGGLLLPLSILFPLCRGSGGCLVGMQVVNGRTQGA